MRRKIYIWIAALAIAVILVAGTALTGTIFLAQGGNESGIKGEPVLIRRGDVDEVDRYGRIIDEYGKNILLDADEENLLELKEKFDVELLEDRTHLSVRGYEFDRREGFPDFSEKLDFDILKNSQIQSDSQLEEKLTMDESDLNTDRPPNRETYIIQMLGPRNPEWRNELENMEVDVIGSIHNYGYEVRMSPERAEQVQNLDYVEWVELYQPGFKISPELTMNPKEIIDEVKDESSHFEAENDLLDNKEADIREALERAQPYYPEELVVEILLFDDMLPSPLEEIDANVNRIQSATEMPDAMLVTAVIGDPSDLVELAQISEVYHISPNLEPQLHEMSSQIIAGGSWNWAPQWEWDDDDQPVTPVEPYRHDDPEWVSAGPLTAQMGYTGEDYIISVADTGIGDGTLGEPGHPDFGERVISGYDWSAGSDEPPFSDGSGHGTGVAGMAASDSYHGTGYNFPHEELDWTGIESWKDYYASMGVAPEANIHNSRIADDDGDLVIPDDLRKVPEQAIQQEPDLLGQTHSWGMSGARGGYAERTRHIDQAVRDANRDTEKEEPVVITFSAGNDGGIRGENSVGEPGGTAKNAVSVGGTANYQPDSEFMDYSPNADRWDVGSWGWTDDNRIKPDVAAPANNLLTTSYEGPEEDPNYVGYSGTSFSSPAAQGAAAVIADWYEEHPLVEGRPSPAMTRAILTNTATPTDFTGDGTIDRIPNKYMGWGRIDLTPLVDHDLGVGGPFMMYDRINEEMEDTYLTTGETEEYTVAPLDSDEPLKITLAWDDPAASAGAEPTLQNDLRLEVEGPEDVYRGNAFAEDAGERSTSTFSYPETEVISDFDFSGDGYDDVNNLLSVYIENPEPTDYEVRVIGEDIPEYANPNIEEPNQDFALAVQNSFVTEDGIFSIDSERYAEEDRVEFMVIDEDVMDKDTTEITISSITDGGDGEIRDEQEVTLRGPRTGIVRGYIDIGPDEENKGLQVEHGDLLEAEYYDESMDEYKYEYADIDGVPPRFVSNISLHWYPLTTLEHNRLTWDLSEDDEEEIFEGYRIYRAESIEGEPNEWEHIETLDPGTTEYIDEDVGKYDYTRYWYEVAAVDDVGNENKTGYPVIESPAIRIDFPSSGDQWTSGNEEEIEWYVANGGVEVEISAEYSTDAGETWLEIFEGMEVSQGYGSYTWEVDEVNGTNKESLVRMRVEDTAEVDDYNLGLLEGNQRMSSTQSLSDAPWPQMGFDQRRTGQSPFDTSDNEGAQLWTFEAEDVFMSNAAVGPDGTIYAASTDNNLYAINPDGTEKWSFETDDSIRESSPALGQDPETGELRVYIGSDDSTVYAVDAEDGTEIWAFEEPSGEIYSSPNKGDDGTIYVGSHEEYWDDGALFAINPDGTEKWRFTEPYDSVGSSPAIGEDPETGEERVYVGAYDENLYAVDPDDGSEVWRFEEPTGWTLSPPTVADDGTIYVGSSDDTLHAVNPDGTEKWNFSVGDDIYGSPLIAEDGTIYVGSYDNNIYAVDPDDGGEIWRFKTQAEVRRGGAIGDDGRIYYGSTDNNLYAINPDGTEAWTYDVGRDIRTGPAICEEGNLYFGADDSKVHAVGAPWEPFPVPEPEVHTDDEMIILDWEEPGDGGAEIKHYNIYRDNQLIAEEPTTTYLDTDVENWEEYTYEISAVNDVGEGERSPAVTTTPSPYPVNSEYFTLTEYEPPEIEAIDSPTMDDTWYINTTEMVNWTIDEGDGNLTSLELEYSLDGGETWKFIDEIEDPETVGEYEWDIPIGVSQEAQIRLTVEDEYNLIAEELSDSFKIIAAEPPENLDVDYISIEEEVLFHDTMDDGESNQGYEMGEVPEGINKWDVRDHGAFVGEYSWDFGNADYEEVEGGGISWLISPEIEVPEDSRGAELTFQQWRDFDYRYEGGNLRISTDGETWNMLEPMEGYPDTISEEFDNPLAGEPAWTDSEDWEKVTFDLDEYIGETVKFNWTAGVDYWEGDEEGWRIDDINVTSLQPQPHDGEIYDVHNRLTWDSSPDDSSGEETVEKYNIYRSDEKYELGEHIDSVNAEGSEEYKYIDEDRGTQDHTTWWYTVKAVGEEDVEDEIGQSAQEPLAPYLPVELEPEDGSAISVKQHENTELSFNAGHGCMETSMEVSFYDAKTNKLIDEVNDVYANERVTVEWNQLENAEYSWYAEIEDGDYLLTSEDFTFMVDSENPEVEIYQPEQDDILAKSDVIVAWEGQDDWSGIDYYEFRLRDYIPWTDVGNETYVQLEDVPNDDHIFDVRATDHAGNQVKDIIEFTVNTADPVVEIVNPQHLDVVGEPELKVEWNGYDDHIDLVSYEVRLNDESWVDVGLSEHYIIDEVPEEGENLIRVRATDEAGNQYVEFVPFLYDTTEPVVDITAPGESEIFNHQEVNVAWEGYDENSYIEKYEVRLNNNGWINTEPRENKGQYVAVIDDIEGYGDDWAGILEDELPDHYEVEHIHSDDALEDIHAYNAYWVHGLESDNENEWFEETDDVGTIYTSQFTGAETLTQRSEVLGDPESVTESNDLARWHVTNNHPILKGVAEPGDELLIHTEENEDGASFTDTDAHIYAEAEDGDNAFGVDEKRKDVLLTAISYGTFVDDEFLTEDAVEILANSVDYMATHTIADLPTESEYTFTDIPEGEHTAYVRATDSVGNKYTEEVNFTIDTPEAKLEITSPEDGFEKLTYEQSLTIEGETDLTSTIYIDGEEVEVNDEGYFVSETILDEGLNIFQAKAEHPDGDVAETKVYVLYLPQIPELQNDIEDLQDEIDDNRDIIDDLEAQLHDIQTQLDELEADLEIELGELREQIEELEQKLEELEQKLEELEEEELEEEELEEDEGVPGFTAGLLMVTVVIVVAIYYKKESKS